MGALLGFCNLAAMTLVAWWWGSGLEEEEEGSGEGGLEWSLLLLMPLLLILLLLLLLLFLLLLLLKVDVLALAISIIVCCCCRSCCCSWCSGCLLLLLDDECCSRFPTSQCSTLGTNAYISSPMLRPPVSVFPHGAPERRKRSSKQVEAVLERRHVFLLGGLARCAVAVMLLLMLPTR